MRSATARTVTEVLVESDWTGRAEAHRARVEAFTAPYRRRVQQGGSHPVWDFLFTYYSFRPRQLRVWHPGYGVVLGGVTAGGYLRRSGYTEHPDGVTLGHAYLRSRAATVDFVTKLLRATATRPAQFGCFGMHEWAMVYRAADVRHQTVPLRLSRADTDAVVEAVGLRCTHFDAFRFFTPDAACRNRTRPSRENQVDTEQPGCVHATMDLYKWAYKLGPLIASDLLMDCLRLAADARELDMRASPYDLSGYGFEPVTVEEPAGRAEYTRLQSALAAHAAPLREALLRRCEQLRDHATDRMAPHR